MSESSSRVARSSLLPDPTPSPVDTGEQGYLSRVWDCFSKAMTQLVDCLKKIFCCCPSKSIEHKKSKQIELLPSPAPLPPFLPIQDDLRPSSETLFHIDSNAKKTEPFEDSEDELELGPPSQNFLPNPQDLYESSDDESSSYVPPPKPLFNPLNVDTEENIGVSFSFQGSILEGVQDVLDILKVANSKPIVTSGYPTLEEALAEINSNPKIKR